MSEYMWLAVVLYILSCLNDECCICSLQLMAQMHTLSKCILFIARIPWLSYTFFFFDFCAPIRCLYVSPVIICSNYFPSTRHVRCTLVSPVSVMCSFFCCSGTSEYASACSHAVLLQWTVKPGCFSTEGVRSSHSLFVLQHAFKWHQPLYLPHRTFPHTSPFTVMAGAQGTKRTRATAKLLSNTNSVRLFLRDLLIL